MMKKMRITGALLLCFAMMISLFGCSDGSSDSKKDKKDKKDKKKSEKIEEDDEDEEEEETESETETDPTDDPTYDTYTNVEYEASNEDSFTGVSSVLLGMSEKDFEYSVVDGVDVLGYQGDGFDLELFKFSDEDEAAGKFQEYLDLYELTVEEMGSEARVEIDDEQVVFDEDLIMADGSSKHLYGIVALSENYIYYMVYDGDDVDKMWNLTNTIGTLGFMHPYYLLGADPDMERLTASGLSMDELLDIAADLVGCDRSDFEEGYRQTDCLEAYEFYNDDIYIGIDMYDLPYTTQIYLNSYYMDVESRYPGEFEMGDQYDCIFGEFEDGDVYFVGGMFKSDYYLITIETGDKELIKEFIDQMGLPTPGNL